MHSPRTLALAGALLLAPALSSCGFDYSTDQVNTISAGINERSGDVDLLGSVIVAEREGSGTLITTLASSSEAAADALVSVQPTGESMFVADTFAPIPVPARGATSLAQTGGVRLTGEFGAGDFVSLTVGFESGQTSTIEIPVVLPCYQYDGLDNAPPPPDEAVPTGEEYSCDPAPGADEEPAGTEG